MRKVLLDLAVTLDGFIEGLNGEVDWCIMDEEMAFEQFLSEIDTIIYGKKSYELWGGYTPSDKASECEKQIWALVHRKISIFMSSKKSGKKSRRLPPTIRMRTFLKPLYEEPKRPLNWAE